MNLVTLSRVRDAATGNIVRGKSWRVSHEWVARDDLGAVIREQYEDRVVATAEEAAALVLGICDDAGHNVSFAHDIGGKRSLPWAAACLGNGRTHGLLGHSTTREYAEMRLLDHQHEKHGGK